MKMLSGAAFSAPANILSAAESGFSRARPTEEAFHVTKGKKISNF